MIICAVVFAITAFCALFVPAVTSVDLSIIRFVQNFLSAIPSEIPATFTKLGSSGKLTTFVIAIGIILILFRKYQNAVIFLCGMPFVYAFYKFLKICFERPRPPVDMRLVEASNFSFPSGHSTMSMMFYGFLIYFAYKFIKNKILRNVIITFLCFAFVPFVPQFSIAVWKDVPFAMFMVWFLIGIIEMITNEENFFGKKRYLLLFIIVTLCVMFFRNNGIYIVLLTLPFAILWRRKYWKQILIIFVIPIVFYYIITGPVFTKLNIAKSASKEMLSIPMQQMARIVKYKGYELSEEDKNVIGQYININTAAENYNPTISDPIKNEFNDGTFNQDKLNLIKLYIKLAIKYPGETLEALVGNTYGYYYPEVVTYPVATGVYKSPFEAEQFMKLEETPIVEIPILDSMINAIYEKQIPIVSLIANIGFVFWIVLGLVFYNIYQKRYKYLLMFISVGILYLTCLASPVSGELRYIYSMFVSLPLFIGFSIKNDKSIQKNYKT